MRAATVEAVDRASKLPVCAGAEGREANVGHPLPVCACHSPVNRRHLDVGALDGDGPRLALAARNDAEPHRGPRRPSDDRDRRVGRLALQRPAVGPGDQVAALQARALRRGAGDDARHPQPALDPADGEAHALELAGRVGVELLEALRVEVAREAVVVTMPQLVDHAGDRRVVEKPPVDGVEVVVLDLAPRLVDGAPLERAEDRVRDRNPGERNSDAGDRAERRSLGGDRRSWRSPVRGAGHRSFIEGCTKGDLGSDAEEAPQGDAAAER